jgi:predicted ribosomally synthesized peptide with nif11-like leader
MGAESVQKFIQAVNEPTELQAKCREVLDGAPDPSGFVALARENGFEFSESDVLLYFREVLGARQPEELTEEDLKEIAVSAGAKDSPTAATRLGDAVRLFKRLSLNYIPVWTGFAASPPPEKLAE